LESVNLLGEAELALNLSCFFFEEVGGRCDLAMIFIGGDNFYSGPLIVASLSLTQLEGLLNKYV